MNRATFFAMALPGLVSLASLSNAPHSNTVDIAPFANVHLADLLIPPRLSFFGGAFKVSEFEYWGSHVPLVFVLLAIAGIVLARQRETLRSNLTALLVLAVIAAILSLNPFNGPITLIRRLPMGSGFRVSGRFLPFFYFVLLVPASFGMDVLLRHPNTRARVAALGFLALLACVELLPVKLSPSAVKAFKIPAAVASDGAHGAFTLIMPRDAYTNVLDTYQVSMNVPVVHLSYLAREDPESVAIRAKRFPALYPNPKKLSERVLSQMKNANVRYVLFEDQQQYYAGTFYGEPVAEHDGAILVRYSGPASP
jgi:hypothetical protein